MCAVRSNVKDLLGFINTVIVTPETLNLTKVSVALLTTPIVVPLLSNGTKNGNFTDGEGFAKGVSAFGSPGEPHGVSLPPLPSSSTKFLATLVPLLLNETEHANVRHGEGFVKGTSAFGPPDEPHRGEFARLHAIFDLTLQTLPGAQSASRAPAPAFPI